MRHAKVVCDDSGNPKGYAFVRFGSAQESERAVQEMDGFELDGRKIHLNLANRQKPSRGDRRSQPYGPPQYGSQRGVRVCHKSDIKRSSPNDLPNPVTVCFTLSSQLQAGGGKRPRNPISPDDPNNTTLFIGGTGPYLQEDALWREFSLYGELIAVRLPATRRGFAFVRFRSREAATNAKNALSGQQVPSLNNLKAIRIEWATEQVRYIEKMSMQIRLFSSAF